ncbi:hypothetical protein [Flavobacterium undicola]|uniref:hypothetical protein n=1 Tax=Flavobacterium undicola TaxID=1932779 RepID=UPI0013787CC5|nr:hypothetical protein [Flavobacterium undicola]MBA0884940.1 hypothetical protein [Flavobacterium undicola]
MSKQNLDSRVFSLASNLFGFGNTTEKKSIQETIATAIATTLQTENRIMAVYPAIVVEAFAITMDKYRKYISAYNFKTNAENEQIEKHNADVRSFLRENQLNEVQKEFAKVFFYKSKSLKPREYNDNADAFMKDYGLILEKKKIQTVKYATELVFQNLLHLYNSQLMKRNEQYMKLRVTTIRPIEEFKINSFLVTELKRKGISSLDLCTKTVRNHRQRLEECGVFVEYVFKGQNRPVEVHINAEILTVLDLKTSKLITTENQQLTSENEKELPDNNENTRTDLNECQMNENVKNISHFDKEFPSVTPSYLFFTGTPASKLQNSTEVAVAKSVKVSETLSEKLQNLIIHPQELAVNLANKEYNNYKPIDTRYLFKEAYSGTMLKEDFRELVIQDFFKSISKIYKNTTPFAGSWKKAIALYMQNKWIAFTGEAFNKAAIVDDIQQMRWRAEWARKWFIKNDFPPLFPYEYFDMTRKTSKEVGFEYTKAKWGEHLQGKAKYEALKKKQEANAVRRKEAINHAKKCENEVNRFFKNKITMPQLFDYVEKNLPAEYLEKLPQMIEKKSLKINEKVSYVDNDFAQYDFSEF